MSLIIWRQLALTIPDEWEMLLFGRDLSSGRCTFADRYQHRLELNWAVTPGAPDFERMMEDYRLALGQNPEIDSVWRTEIDGWEGLVTTAEGTANSRFGQYFPTTRCLVELVFIWPKKRDERLERRVLASFHEEPADGGQRWRAFGMDLWASADLALRECVVQPGQARMLFAADRDAGREERFERLGMVAHWLHSPLADWLRRRQPAGVRIHATREAERQGHTVVSIHGDRLARGTWRLAGRRPFASYAWQCPTDGRLYVLTCAGPACAELTETAVPRLVCCPSFGERSEGVSSGEGETNNNPY